LGAINLNVIPGVEMKYRWPLADAVAIDKSPGMVDESRNKVSEAIATWGGELPRTGEMAV
jgi:trans-aconitate methyltransferase